MNYLKGQETRRAAAKRDLVTGVHTPRPIHPDAFSLLGHVDVIYSAPPTAHSFARSRPVIIFCPLRDEVRHRERDAVFIESRSRFRSRPCPPSFEFAGFGVIHIATRRDTIFTSRVISRVSMEISDLAAPPRASHFLLPS